MFGPEGYLTVRELAGLLDDWVERIICANVLEDMGQGPERAFLARVDPQSLIVHLERWRALGSELSEQEVARRGLELDPDALSRFEKAMDERYFDYSILMNMMIAKIYQNSSPLVASIDGTVLSAPEILGFHMDRLDWCEPWWPLRENAAFQGYFSAFDKGTFSGADIDARFCFLDRYTGLVTLKNNSMSGYLRASHVDLASEQLERLERAIVRPFVDWSLVWNPKQLPDTGFEIFQWFGWLKDGWEVEEELSQQKKNARKRGRKPSGAREEYYRRYPDGKPPQLSYDAISAELTAAGFPISVRMLSKYENSRPTAN